MSVADELAKLQQLHDAGTLTDEEFREAKAQLLEGGAVSSGAASSSGMDDARQDADTRTWSMLIHLSQFAGYVVPLAGLVVPIVLWQIKKNDLPGVDAHGKVVANWIISQMIYFAIGLALCFVIIGFPLLIVLGILSIVSTIIGAVKANNGEVWKYPLSIQFFS